MAIDADRLWHVEDVAGYLGIPESSVYKMTAPKARFRIPHIRLNGLLRFRKTDIDDWIEQNRIASHGKHSKAQVGR